MDSTMASGTGSAQSWRDPGEKTPCPLEGSRVDGCIEMRTRHPGSNRLHPLSWPGRCSIFPDMEPDDARIEEVARRIPNHRIHHLGAG